MNIQIFGKSKSFDTKKAERWFKERRIKYQYIDLVSKGVSPGEYRSIRAAVGSFDALVDKDCRAYEALYMAYITPQARRKSFWNTRSCSPHPLSATGSRPPWAIARRYGRRGNRNKGSHPCAAGARFFRAAPWLSLCGVALSPCSCAPP